MSRCVRCQTIEVARMLGREQELIDELYRIIDSLNADRLEASVAGPTIPRDEHERIVAKLNERIAAKNQRKAPR